MGLGSCQGGNDARRTCGSCRTSMRITWRRLPFGLAQRLIRALPQPSRLVFDPFCRAGSSGAAAFIEGREFLGAEIKREHVELVCDRLKLAGKGQLVFRPAERAIHFPRATEKAQDDRMVSRCPSKQTRSSQSIVEAAHLLDSQLYVCPCDVMAMCKSIAQPNCFPKSIGHRATRASPQQFAERSKRPYVFWSAGRKWVCRRIHKILVVAVDESLSLFNHALAGTFYLPSSDLHSDSGLRVEAMGQYLSGDRVAYQVVPEIRHQNVRDSARRKIKAARPRHNFESSGS